MKASLVLVEMVVAALLMLATVQVSGAAVHSSSALRAKRSSEPEAYESTAAYMTVIQFMMDNGYTSPDKIAINNEAIKAFILTISVEDLVAFGVELEKTSNQSLLTVFKETKFKYGDSVGQLQYMLYTTAVMDSLWVHTEPNNP